MWFNGEGPRGPMVGETGLFPFLHGPSGHAKVVFLVHASANLSEETGKSV